MSPLDGPTLTAFTAFIQCCTLDARQNTGRAALHLRGGLVSPSCETGSAEHTWNALKARGKILTRLLQSFGVHSGLGGQHAIPNPERRQAHTLLLWPPRVNPKLPSTAATAARATKTLSP